MSIVQVDGIDYAVNFLSCDRTADFLDKYAERTNDGKLHRELIGVYFNYKLKIGSPRTTTELTAYQAFWDKITEATEFHSITVPDGVGTGTFTFVGYVANVGDSIRRKTETATFWTGMTVNFIAQKPRYT